MDLIRLASAWQTSNLRLIFYITVRWEIKQGEQLWYYYYVTIDFSSFPPSPFLAQCCCFLWASIWYYLILLVQQRNIIHIVELYQHTKMHLLRYCTKYSFRINCVAKGVQWKIVHLIRWGCFLNFKAGRHNWFWIL